MFAELDPYEEYSIHQTRDRLWICGRLSVPATALHTQITTNVVNNEKESISDQKELWQVITIPRNIKHEVEWQIPVDAPQPLSQIQLDNFLKNKAVTLVVSNVKALFGILKTAVGYILVVVTKSDIVAHINSSPIYVVRDHLLIPLVYKSRLTRDETRCRNLISLTELNGNCFFSLKYSLFRNWQSILLFQENKDELSESFETQMNYGYRYLWNAHALQPIINSIKQTISVNRTETAKMLKMCIVPFICGYVNYFSRYVSSNQASRTAPQSVKTESSISSSNSATSKNETLNESSHILEGEIVANYLHGSTSMKEKIPKQDVLMYLLISRRCTYFAGTRYFRRGMNAAGDVANEVETEQILCISKETTDNDSSTVENCLVTSYVQYRGSIPLFWHHINLLSPMPGIVLETPVYASNDSSNSTLYSSNSNLHWDRLEATYGKCIHVVNLLRQNPTHREGILHAAYHHICEEIISTASYRRLNYVEFDLLKDGKQHLSMLVESLTQMVFETGVCTMQASAVKEGKRVIKNQFDEDSEGIAFSNEDNPFLQHGIIRTNCVDCLDRTNLVQFLAARVAVMLQLEALQEMYATAPSCPKKTDDDDVEDGNNIVQENSFLVSESDLAYIQSHMLRLWTEHGDRVAQQYAGSSAMHRMYENDSHNSEKIDGLSENVDMPKEEVEAGKDEISDELIDISTYFRNATTPLFPSSGILKGELVADLDLVDLLPSESTTNVPPQSGNFSDEIRQTTINTAPLHIPLMLKNDLQRIVEDAEDAASSSVSGSSSATIPKLSSKSSNKNTLSATAVDTSKLTMVSNLASNAVISIQRYFLNISSDFERQYAFDYLLGNNTEHGQSPETPVSIVWKSSPYPENNRISSKTLASDSTIRSLMEIENS